MYQTAVDETWNKPRGRCWHHKDTMGRWASPRRSVGCIDKRCSGYFRRDLVSFRDYALWSVSLSRLQLSSICWTPKPGNDQFGECSSETSRSGAHDAPSAPVPAPYITRTVTRNLDKFHRRGWGRLIALALVLTWRGVENENPGIKAWRKTGETGGDLSRFEGSPRLI